MVSKTFLNFHLFESVMSTNLFPIGSEYVTK